MRRPIWCKAFLILLETETRGEVKRAAHLAGVSHQNVYYRRRVDPAFDRDVRAVYDRLESRHVEISLGRIPEARAV